MTRSTLCRSFFVLCAFLFYACSDDGGTAAPNSGSGDESDVGGDVVSDSGADADVEADAEADAQPDAEADAEPDAEADAEPDAGMDASTDAEDADGGEDADGDVDADSGIDADGGTPPESCTLLSAGEACGGDIVGAWTADDIPCADTADFDAALDDVCPDAEVTWNATAAGTLEFTDDGLFARRATVDVTLVAALPDSCVPVDCGTIETTLAENFDTATCTDSDDGCSCVVTDTVETSDAGFYSTDGGEITINPETAVEETFLYCVETDTLTARQTPDDSREGGFDQQYVRGGGFGCSDTGDAQTCSPDFGEADACGGELEGTWQVEDTCGFPTEADFAAELAVICEDASAEVEVSTEGTLAFIDGIVGRDVTVTTTASATIPGTCPGVGIAGCATIQASVRPFLPGATCVGDGAGGCECSGVRVDEVVNLTTYETDGGVLTIDPDGTASTFHYCVAGGTLQARQFPEDTAEGGFTQLYSRGAEATDCDR